MAEMEGFEPPDGLTRQLISSQPRYDHFDTSPRCIFKALRVSVRLRAECRNRRTKRRKTVDIQLLKSVDNPEKPEISRVFGDGSSTDLLDFECRTFDLSDNSPYTSSVILAPEECKKNTQERYEIVKSEPAQSPVRRTFSADETAGASKNFESVPLWPLRYRSECSGERPGFFYFT